MYASTVNLLWQMLPLISAKRITQGELKKTFYLLTCSNQETKATKKNIFRKLEIEMIRKYK
jgi:hypothetical protein